jgi:hypothetical protein
LTLLIVLGILLLRKHGITIFKRCSWIEFRGEREFEPGFEKAKILRGKKDGWTRTPYQCFAGFGSVRDAGLSNALLEVTLSLT